MSSRGILFVVSAPAGTGKTTLVAKLTQEFKNIVQSVSYTTRSKREGEVDGVHYTFITQEEFEERRKGGDFLEWAEVFGYYYGTSASYVDAELEKGHHVILVIDTQGAAQVRKLRNAVSIFILPPSMEELERRLLERKTEGPEKVKERLARAKLEMESAKNYQYHIINDDLEAAYQALRSIIIAEEHK